MSERDYLTICLISKKNVLYQLTPAESYQLGLVKKLEVLTVSESNDEATMKLEISQVQSTASQVKAKLKLWKLNKTKGRFESKESGWLKKDDNLADKSSNESYRDFTINRIYKSMADRKWHVAHPYIYQVWKLPLVTQECYT